MSALATFSTTLRGERTRRAFCRSQENGLFTAACSAWSAKLLVDTWNRNVSWESKLGIIAQALEAFHRSSSHRQTFVTRDQYEPIEQSLRQKISERTPDKDLQTSLKKRVEFGNQVSLRRRTKDLMRAMPPSLRNAFGRWQNLADDMVGARSLAIIFTVTRAASWTPSSGDGPCRRDISRRTAHVALLQALSIPDDVIAHSIGDAARRISSGG